MNEIVSVVNIHIRLFTPRSNFKFVFVESFVKVHWKSFPRFTREILSFVNKILQRFRRATNPQKGKKWQNEAKQASSWNPSSHFIRGSLQAWSSFPMCWSDESCTIRKKGQSTNFLPRSLGGEKNLFIHSKGKRIMELKKQGWRRKEENNYLRWNWLLSHTKIKGLKGNGTFSTSFSLRSSVDNFSLASVCVFCAIEWQTISHPLWAPAVVVASPEESLVRSLSQYDL